MLQFNENLLIRLYIDIDDFCKKYQDWRTVNNKSTQRWHSQLSCSEVMTLLVFYHQSGYKCFEYFYEKMVLSNLKDYFPSLVGYKRFLRLIPNCLDLLHMFAQWQTYQSRRTGIFYVDSKRLPVCHNKRIHSHKVFDGVAARGKSSTGWFYGLKVHLVINNFGEIVSFLFTSANFSDNNHKVLAHLFEGLQGNCYGDKGHPGKGYLSTLFEEFYQKGLKIVTKLKKNMKNKLMVLQEKYHLCKRGIIESVNDILMTVQDIEHTRHRSPVNALAHMTCALIAYNYLPEKPSVFFPEISKIKP